jgi:hypothetical protein
MIVSFHRSNAMGQSNYLLRVSRDRIEQANDFLYSLRFRIACHWQPRYRCCPLPTPVRQLGFKVRPRTFAFARLTRQSLSFSVEVPPARAILIGALHDSARRLNELGEGARGRSACRS